MKHQDLHFGTEFLGAFQHGDNTAFFSPETKPYINRKTTYDTSAKTPLSMALKQVQESKEKMLNTSDSLSDQDLEEDEDSDEELFKELRQEHLTKSCPLRP